MKYPLAFALQLTALPAFAHHTTDTVHHAGSPLWVVGFCAAAGLAAFAAWRQAAR